MREKLSKIPFKKREDMELLCMKALPFRDVPATHVPIVSYLKKEYPARKYQGLEWFVYNTMIALSRKYI